MQGDERSGLVTPEAVALHLDLAGIGSRAVGAVVDGLIQGAVLVAGFIAGSLVQSAGEGFLLVVVVGIVFSTLVLLGFQGIFEGLWEGRTPGKRAAGIRVVSSLGQPVTWRHVVIRSIFRLIDMSPIGVMTIILSKRSQRFGDMAAGTIVVRDAGAPEPAVLQVAPDPERDQYAATLDTSTLSEREYGLVRSFLQRRASMSPEAVADVASKLAVPLRARLGREPEGLSDERFLEAIVVSVRRRTEGA